jgi:hypothetical protein
METAASQCLIISDSLDTTADLVVSWLAPNCFRLNSDLISDYMIEVSSQCFRVTDPTGRSIDTRHVGSVYWRKPFSTEEFLNPSPEDAFFTAECRYLIREIYNIARASGAYSLVEAEAEHRFGKLCQLMLAEQFFSVPPWRVILGHHFVAPPLSIVKSLSGAEVDEENVLYTTRIDGQELDRSHIWLWQHAIAKRADITVCYVDGDVFAFELLADPNSPTDWRRDPGVHEMSDWAFIDLSSEFTKKISEFMGAAHLLFGRLDFVVDSSGETFFLEVNPNGQWAWLDQDNRYGLIDAMVDGIRGLSQRRT